MRGKDGQEKREEPKSQLMLVQLLPEKRKEKNKANQSKTDEVNGKKAPQNNVDKLEKTQNAKEDLEEEKNEERESMAIRKSER